MNCFRYPFFVWLFTASLGMVFLFSPLGHRIEETLGLSLLFTLRGPQEPPDSVVIVNLDSASAEALGLPDDIIKWPRTIHARIVAALKRLGAAAVVFDVHFKEPRNSEHDIEFAEAIKDAGNVILFEELRHRSLDQGVQLREKGESLQLDYLMPPIPLLAGSALGLAPFPLPKLPVRVNQAWVFKTSVGESPTLPAAALQVAGLKYYEKLHGVLSSRNPLLSRSLPPSSDEAILRFGFVGLMRELRRIFLEDPGLADRLLSEITAGADLSLSGNDLKILQSIVRMYGGGNSIYLNYYGPAATIPTVSSSELILSEGGWSEPERARFHGKAVFVGVARRNWSEQKDGFYTVYSQPDGLDLSGVEIAATAFANLVENKAVRPFANWQSTALLMVWGACLAYVCYVLSSLSASVFFVLLGALYLAVGGNYFAVGGYWPPVITTLAFQPLTAFLSSLLLKHVITRREKENMRKALEFYLPERAVQALSQDLSFIRNGDQMVYSACLLTDAQRYTTLSERMEPRALSLHMKEYFSYLYRPVTEHKGLVCDVVGDSMLALWPSTRPDDFHLRQNACQAAIKILAEVNLFNQKHQGSMLPTRVGLHYGYILMGNIGAESHFEYKPVGDTINTVSRIENLNKRLGTRILASEETVREVTGIRTRDLGRFLLAGKSRPIGINEILGDQDAAEVMDKEFHELFAEALAHFQKNRWDKAINSFTRCISRKSDDGPCRFYLQLCESYRLDPPSSDWQGVVRIDK